MPGSGVQPLDRLVGWLLLAVGAVLVVTGAVQVSRAAYLADQLSFLASAGIGGLTCLVLGGTVLLRSGLRDAWGKLDAIEDSLRPAAAGEIALGDDDLPARACEVSVDVGSPETVR